MPLKTDAKLKAEPIEVSEDSPFLTDSAGGRKELAVSLTRLVASVPTPYVLAVSAPWGTGKTTFMNMWAHHAGQIKTPREKLIVVKLNAWESDFADDPLVPFLSKIEETKLLFKKDAVVADQVEKLKLAGMAVAKAVIPLAVKIATLNTIDADKEIEKALSDAAGAGVKDALDHFENEKGVIGKFRDSLAQLAKTVANAEGGGRLVIFVDELDRCRPDYALRTLERMKHIFGVEGVAFVLFIDREQLGVSLRHMYGEGLNSNEYLKRFVDNECVLPLPNYQQVIASAFQRYDLLSAYGSGTYQSPNSAVEGILALFVWLAQRLKPSIRSLEQCTAQLCIALLSMQRNEHKHADFLAFLILLKSQKPELYRGYLNGSISGTELLPRSFDNALLESGDDADWIAPILGTIEFCALKAMKNRGQSKLQLDIYRASQNEGDDQRVAQIKVLMQQSFSDNAPNHQWLLRTMEYVGAFDT